MKKAIKIVMGITVFLLIIFVIWYNITIDMLNLNPTDVKEIVVFNGNTGNTTHITNESEIEKIIENLNDVKLKRGKLSVGYLGYSFKITICLSDDKEAGDWNTFIINSENTIRKDPFFYHVSDGKIDYDYITSIVN